MTSTSAYPSRIMVNGVFYSVFYCILTRCDPNTRKMIMPAVFAHTLISTVAMTLSLCSTYEMLSNMIRLYCLHFSWRNSRYRACEIEREPVSDRRDVSTVDLPNGKGTRDRDCHYSHID
jgi:hypothetical protein